MKRNTRYSILFSAAMLAVASLTGCQRDELAGEAGNGSDILNFSVGFAGSGEIALSKGATLTSEDGTVSIPLSCTVTDGIGVDLPDAAMASKSASMTKGQQINSETEFLNAELKNFIAQGWNTDKSPFMPSETVNYTDGLWKTADTYRWRGSDSKTFLAYANLPSSGATVTNYVTPSVKQTFTYTVPTDARQQNDIMLGWYEGNGGGTATAAITMVHPLTAVVFKKGEIDASVTAIKSISISGVYESGAADVTYALSSGNVVPTYSWGSSRTGSQTVTISPAKGSSELEVSADGKIGTPFIVLPQTIAAGTLTLTITVVKNGSDAVLSATVPAGEWKAGKTNTYTIGYNPPLLSGKFSVSATEYVQFSRGNLFCTNNGGSFTFDFEQNQYDFRSRNGATNDQAVINGFPGNTPVSTSGLFQWVTSNSGASSDDLACYGAFSELTMEGAKGNVNDELDYGGCMGGGNLWHSLKKSEMDYIVNTRANAAYLKRWSNVCGVNGLLLAPDVETTLSAMPEYLKDYTTDEEWKSAVYANGLVFLPAAGFLCLHDGEGGGDPVGVSHVNENGYYYSSSSDSGNDFMYLSYYLNFTSEGTAIGSFNRSYGRSVRLVQKFDKPDKPYSGPEYVEIAAMYDGIHVTTLKWATQNLAITESGNKPWKGKNDSAVKIPGTDKDVIVGDYFQWAAHVGYCGNATDADKGLLVYTAFNNKGCGDKEDYFTFKSSKSFQASVAPYYSGSSYTKYPSPSSKKVLEITPDNDDVANIILGGTWRMPTSAEIQAMKAATYWESDATDGGVYVYAPKDDDDIGKYNYWGAKDQYDKSEALLFIPGGGYGNWGNLQSAVTNVSFWSSSLDSSDSNKAYIVDAWNNYDRYRRLVRTIDLTDYKRVG